MKLRDNSYNIRSSYFDFFHPRQRASNGKLDLPLRLSLSLFSFHSSLPYLLFSFLINSLHFFSFIFLLLSLLFSSVLSFPSSLISSFLFSLILFTSFLFSHYSSPSFRFLSSVVSSFLFCPLFSLLCCFFCPLLCCLLLLFCISLPQPTFSRFLCSSWDGYLTVTTSQCGHHHRGVRCISFGIMGKHYIEKK